MTSKRDDEGSIADAAIEVGAVAAEAAWAPAAVGSYPWAIARETRETGVDASTRCDDEAENTDDEAGIDDSARAIEDDGAEARALLASSSRPPTLRGPALRKCQIRTDPVRYDPILPRIALPLQRVART